MNIIRDTCSGGAGGTPAPPTAVTSIEKRGEIMEGEEEENRGGGGGGGGGRKGKDNQHQPLHPGSVPEYNIIVSSYNNLIKARNERIMHSLHCWTRS
jgi:hypothetical protein